ncbi:CD1871A family CXXC motif-containing protein [Dorea sp. D27]|nr:CD1871A family CXXC motif-containing protein [Dorea sp. D27]KMZ53713.1 hypothetical protein HMPREF0980_02244 [Dorea sp. D27]
MCRRKVRWIQAALLSTAALFIYIGMTRGEAVTVLTKAVNICLECIGIG